jgi:hypothetical protein
MDVIKNERLRVRLEPWIMPVTERTSRERLLCHLPGTIVSDLPAAAASMTTTTRATQPPSSQALAADLPRPR